MLENLLDTSTLLCLGITFILTSVLFLYFRRSITVLEKAQMEQARLLQSFIANMEMSSMTRQPPVNVSNNGPIASELIEVSDNDSDSDSDSDSDDDSDDNAMSNTHREIIDLTLLSDSDSDSVNNDDTLTNTHHEIIDLLDDVDQVKVIKLAGGGGNLEELYIEELNDNILDSNKDDDDDEDDEDDDDDDDDDEDEADALKEVFSTQDTFITSVAEQMNATMSTQIDYSSLTLAALREVAEGKGLIEKGEKKNKKELIKILNESK